MTNLLERIRAGLVDRYAVERELGSGGAATVYLARDVAGSRMVAVKVLRPELASAVGTERFLREIAIGAGLSHPGILPLIDSGETDGLLFYVMPYVEGESLRQRLERERQLPLGEALDIAREVAAAVAYAHDQRVVHRDIKPDNILFENGRAVVTDFGIARALSAAGSEKLTQTGIAIGTPAYMSPEQAAGNRDVDARSDEYSLSCVVYEMLAGRPPFMGATAQEVMARQTLDPVPPLRSARPAVGDELEAVLMRALEKTPADRFPTIKSFAAALADPAVLRRLPAQRRRRQAMIRRAAVALGAVVLLTAGYQAWRRVARGAEAVATGPDRSRVAVLYFDDTSPDGTLGTVAAGLTEELIDVLSRVRGLRVISPGGVRQWSSGQASLTQVAEALGVGTLVTGGVAAEGDRLRVTVRLTDPVSLEQVASATLERRRADLFRLLDEVTSEVSRFLRQRVGTSVEEARRRSGTRSVGAWELVQRAERLRQEAFDLSLRRGEVASRANVMRADSLLSAAEAMDGRWPALALARGRAALAVAGYLRLPGGISSPEGDRWLAAARQHASRARELGAPEAEVLELEGATLLAEAVRSPAVQDSRLLTRAQSALERAVTLDSSRAPAWLGLSQAYQLLNFGVLADSAARRALEADSWLRGAAGIMSRLQYSALEAGRVDEARRWCEDGSRQFPRDPRFAECELVILGGSGRGRDDVRSAWRILARVETADSAGLLRTTWAIRRYWVAQVLARTGMKDSARAVLGRTGEEADSSQRSAGLLQQAELLVMLGEPDSAMAALAAMIHGQPQTRPLLLRSATLRALSPDPRFQSLARGGAQR